jgi:hypothetical protein
MARELTLPFLGERSYLHGTTLFEELIGAYPFASTISYKLGQIITTNRVRVEQSIDVSERPAASLFLTDRHDTPIRLSVYPSPSSREPFSEPYDEASIVEAARFTGDNVTGPPRKNVSTIKTMVALNKALLCRTLSPSTPGQWLFTRLDIAFYPKDFDRISVTYRSRASFAAVVSDVSTDGGRIGKIIFSWWNRQ